MSCTALINVISYRISFVLFVLVQLQITADKRYSYYIGMELHLLSAYLYFFLDTENASAWDVFPSHAMDDVVFPLLQHHRVPICRVYDALAVRDDLHAGLLPPDCTHFGPDALLYMNAQVLKSLVSNLEPS